jgi:hypothetical protein
MHFAKRRMVMQSDGFDKESYSISTILEDMFQYLDDGLIDKKGQYRRLEKGGRALISIDCLSQ